MPPGGTLRVAFKLEPGRQAPAARLLVDGEDVTDACARRVAGTFPSSRVELVYAPPDGWTPGGHEAAVVAPGAEPDAWTFTVPWDVP